MIINLICFEVIVLTLLTFSMYEKLSKKINSSNPLMLTYMCVLEVKNVKFRENLYLHTKRMP